MIDCLVSGGSVGKTNSGFRASNLREVTLSARGGCNKRYNSIGQSACWWSCFRERKMGRGGGQVSANLISDRHLCLILLKTF